jgi:hypothetical protein
VQFIPVRSWRADQPDVCEVGQREELKTGPCGGAGDHPRLELPRRRSLTAGRDWPAGPLLHDRQAMSVVRQTWVQLIPLCLPGRRKR